ncbi:MAG: UDP-N-acetylmuramoyl-tripeptide--D-alanyl-D-alanine ligase [Chromatiales bacterium]|nr:UDP-N-acetylmuramoyl-tripeptide--D-alanyl-D-alanine ligase [Chromatiales bacterium]
MNDKRIGLQATISEIADWVGAELNGAINIAGVSSDTRTIERGNLFIALRGPNHDGHQHLQMALEKGAVAALVDHQQDIDIPQIVVADTRIALGHLAARWRQQCDTPIVAITGSNGKTTVKEMVASILSQVGQTWSTPGNFNNDIGVPLTLLKLERGDRYAVIEMGANHSGEIDYLTHIAQPQVAVITNASEAHLEGFGSLAGVVKTKGEIFDGLTDDGVAIINRDDPHADEWLAMNQNRRVITFGLGGDADINSAPYEIPLLGQHNQLNACAAIAAATALNVSDEAVAAGLRALKPVKGRLQLRKGINGATVIDDSYNANPSSLYAGLNVLSGFDGLRLLALGDMGELGSASEQAHSDAGTAAKEFNIDQLFASGSLSQLAAKSFGEAGHFYQQQDKLIDALRPLMKSNTTLLVKGSRSSHMDRVADALCEGVS